MEYNFYNPKYTDEIAWVKRVMEYESLIPGFSEEIHSDTEGTLKKYNIPLTGRDISFGEMTVENGNFKLNALYPDTAAARYAEFMDNKFKYRDFSRERCTPSNETMKKWRARQIARCQIELGPKFTALIHTPMTIELADGCSVGCKFCGLCAPKLTEVFRYTPENAEMFGKVITAAKDIIGPAAGTGTLYFASEPLDNPDYELFKADYEKVFGITPQITTAISVKNIERLRPLLKEINETQQVIYRFSALSKEVVLKLFDAFTPQELILTEILPQFEEAPSSNLVHVGRNAKAEEYDDTISCVTGFVVNMVTHKIRLTTPTWADKDHPTGEIILDSRTFTDGDDFAKVLKDMISKNMAMIIPPNEKIRLRKGISCRTSDKEFVLTTDKGIEVRFRVQKDKKEAEFYKNMYDALSNGYTSKRDVVKANIDPEATVGTRTDILYYILNKWWAMGLIETENGIL